MIIYNVRMIDEYILDYQMYQNICWPEKKRKLPKKNCKIRYIGANTSSQNSQKNIISKNSFSAFFPCAQIARVSS